MSNENTLASELGFWKIWTVGLLPQHMITFEEWQWGRCAESAFSNQGCTGFSPSVLILVTRRGEVQTLLTFRCGQNICITPGCWCHSECCDWPLSSLLLSQEELSDVGEPYRGVFHLYLRLCWLGCRQELIFLLDWSAPWLALASSVWRVKLHLSGHLPARLGAICDSQALVKQCYSEVLTASTSS